MTLENMISNIFRKTATMLAANGNIQEKYIELYAKAMEAMIAITINLVSALVIGYFCGMWWYCVILLVTFMPLRSYAGGYHARSYLSCYFQSCGLLILVLLSIKYVVLNGNMDVIVWQLFFASIIIIFLLAPMADKNKPISEKEAIVFKRRTRIVLMVEVITVLILSWLHVTYVYSVVFAISLSAFALVAQIVLEYIERTYKQDDNYKEHRSV